MTFGELVIRILVFCVALISARQLQASFQSKNISIESSRKVLHMNKIVRFTGLFFLLFCLIICLFQIFQASAKVFYLGYIMSLLFAALGYSLCKLYSNHWLKYNDHTISVQNVMGQVSDIKWNEIESVSYENITSFIKIKGNGKHIKIHNELVGLEDFLEMFESKTNINVRDLGIRGM